MRSWARLESTGDIAMVVGAARCDMLIVVAGFSGIYQLHRARQQGLSARVLEAGD